jgi:hypothetical protein
MDSQLRSCHILTERCVNGSTLAFFTRKAHVLGINVMEGSVPQQQNNNQSLGINVMEGSVPQQHNNNHSQLVN